MVLRVLWRHKLICLRAIFAQIREDGGIRQIDWRRAHILLLELFKEHLLLLIGPFPRLLNLQLL